MKKIPTFFKKDANNLALVINEINPECEWALTDQAIATQKFDGTAVAIIKGELYKRYDVKKERQVPENAIPCQEPDEITGHWPHWVKCDVKNPEDKYFFEGLKNLMESRDPIHSVEMGYGTYELCGPKINKNPEKLDKHILIRHGSIIFNNLINKDFESLKSFLMVHDIEGIVFYRNEIGDMCDMCKIKKSNFGLKR